MHLLALDSTGTQEYIFGSNRLRHNIGASHLVARATGSWALEAVVRAASPYQTNVQDAPTLELEDSDDQAYWIEENTDLAAEVLYAGGGNVVVLFREEQVVNDFRRQLSQVLIERAPELTLVEKGQPFDWEAAAGQDAGSTPELSKALDTALRDLGREKEARRIPPRPVNRSVTQSGQIHGQPAIAMQDPPPEADDDEEPYPISAEAKAKEKYLHRANQRLKKLLPLPEGYAYPYQLGKLGQAEGEQSFIAVVHADGDRMGKLLQKVADPTLPEETRRPNRAFVQRMREFSEVVREAALGAMKDMVGEMHAFIEENRNGGEEVELPGVEAPLQLDRRDGDLLLPLRPIVFGGDDVTFVCDGRLGLALAARYVRRFKTRFKTRAEESDLLPPSLNATASAGVSIVKTHYPFSRAYDLAEELTRSAKDQRDQESGPDGSYMDWHVALDDFPGSLEAVRKQYQLSGQTDPRYSSELSLTVRPVAVTGGMKSGENRWEKIRDHVQDFRQTGHARSKVKELREKLRQGPAAVEAFVTRQGLENLLNGNATGFTDNNETFYLDVLELMDLALLDNKLASSAGANSSAANAGDQ
jgi:hypothetical protein